jgi:inorganic pyrophosphatase
MKTAVNLPVTEKSTNALAYLGKKVNVKIDRPLGSRHPEWHHFYPVNYGFVSGTKMADGEELDVYILGVFEPVDTFYGECIAIIHRLNDDDDKLIVVPRGQMVRDEQIRAFTDFQEQYFESEIIRQSQRP